MIWLCLASAGGWAGFAVAAPERKADDARQLLRFEESLDSMGTTFTIVAYGTDRFRLQAAVEGAFEEVKRLEDLLSNYRPESEWSRLNRAAPGGKVRVSEELFRLLAACQGYSRASDGAFDISVGPLMKVWGFYKGSGRFPHRAEIKGAMARVGYELVELDEGNLTVRFRRPGVELDPGGIGKGYAVDRVAGILRQAGIQSALITAGSSSIYGIGSPPGEAKGWRVGIKHPKSPTVTVADVWLRDESMSTSGNYEKFFRANGRLYSHIMDPRTGYPAQGMLSVSVIAPRTLDSEAWSKPFYINGRKQKLPGKQTITRVFLCEDRTEPLCAWLQ